MNDLFVLNEPYFCHLPHIHKHVLSLSLSHTHTPTHTHTHTHTIVAPPPFPGTYTTSFITACLRRPTHACTQTHTYAYTHTHKHTLVHPCFKRYMTRHDMGIKDAEDCSCACE